jgi:hypothetical protein
MFKVILFGNVAKTLCNVGNDLDLLSYIIDGVTDEVGNIRLNSRFRPVLIYKPVEYVVMALKGVKREI